MRNQSEVGVEIVVHVGRVKQHISIRGGSYILNSRRNPLMAYHGERCRLLLQEPELSLAPLACTSGLWLRSTIEEGGRGKERATLAGLPIFRFVSTSEETWRAFP